MVQLNEQTNIIITPFIHIQLLTKETNCSVRKYLKCSGKFVRIYTSLPGYLTHTMCVMPTFWR